ncbi:hypothetical protein PORCRE_2093 [Porphyromonas crevioricanis JCM 15906]|uniref:Uncharacterized protein n=1 Tax=Porphyromonas crevioricanis JCM 15906 TaxID=1305617 RepID=T1DTS2_9PORP|nr:hypothetical protein PORCRE_2093 [Porphyromonas crevioricanis JCM 15906]
MPRNENDRPDGKTHKKMSDMRETRKKKMETQLPYLWNPHK